MRCDIASDRFHPFLFSQTLGCRTLWSNKHTYTSFTMEMNIYSLNCSERLHDARARDGANSYRGIPDGYPGSSRLEAYGIWDRCRYGREIGVRSLSKQINSLRECGDYVGQLAASQHEAKVSNVYILNMKVSENIVTQNFLYLSRGLSSDGQLPDAEFSGLLIDRGSSI